MDIGLALWESPTLVTVEIDLPTGANTTTIFTPPPGRIWRVHFFHLSIKATSGGSQVKGDFTVLSASTAITGDIRLDNKRTDAQRQVTWQMGGAPVLVGRSAGDTLRIQTSANVSGSPLYDGYAILTTVDKPSGQAL